MQKLPTSIPALKYRFLAPHDRSFFAFVGTLRLVRSVKEYQRVGVSSHHWLVGSLPRTDAPNYNPGSRAPKAGAISSALHGRETIALDASEKQKEGQHRVTAF